MSSWSKSHTQMIDQRSELLPPTWCPQPIDGTEIPVGADGVWRSDRERHLARALCAAIDAATEVIVVVTFLLADGEIEQALLRAAARRVRVYVLLASEARLDREPRDDSEFDQRALEEHKAMLAKLAGWALIRSAPGFHAKVLLVDPKRGGRGFLLTANLTREALTRNEELGIALTPAESSAVFEHVAHAMWELAEHELIEPGRLGAAAKAQGIVPPPVARDGVVATLGVPGSIRSTTLDLLRAAQRAITVASFGWDADHEVVRGLCARAKEGLTVTVLARVRPAAMPALLALVAAGARVIGFPWLHAKAITIDDDNTLVMSANLERHGMDDSFELGVVVEGARAAAIRALLHAWTVAAPYELRRAPALGEVLGRALVWVDKKLVEYAVSASAVVQADTVTAASADRLHSDAPAVRRRFGLPHPAHELSITWTVEAPRLAPKAKPHDIKSPGDARPGDPVAFRESSGRIVVGVLSTDDIPRARQIADRIGAAAIVVREGSR